MIAHGIALLGRSAIIFCSSLGSFALFISSCIITLFSTKLNIKTLIIQMELIGVGSLIIVVLTGFFTGMVFALQSYIGFERVGGEQFIGAVVALGVIRELAPVLTGLMVTGRSGSGIAAQIGSMKITEQIDALYTLRISPYRYLIVPRLIAAFLVTPLLTLFSMACAILGGYIVCVYVLELNPEDYINSMKTYVELKDVVGGLIKAAVFGIIFSSIASYYGFYASGGASGVGRATTKSVVGGSIGILISNYILTQLLEWV